MWWSRRDTLLVKIHSWWKRLSVDRPSRDMPLCQYSCQNVVKWCQDVTLWRHAVTSYVIKFRPPQDLKWNSPKVTYLGIRWLLMPLGLRKIQPSRPCLVPKSCFSVTDLIWTLVSHYCVSVLVVWDVKHVNTQTVRLLVNWAICSFRGILFRWCIFISTTWFQTDFGCILDIHRQTMIRKLTLHV